MNALLPVGLCGLLLLQIAHADVPYVSPDGRTVALVGEASDPKPTSSQIRVVDVDCLVKGKTRSECSKIVFEGKQVRGRILWAKDSTSFIQSSVSRFWYKKIDGTAEGAQPQYLWGNSEVDPVAFDPDHFPARAKPSDEPFSITEMPRNIRNGAGEIVGRVLNGEVDQWISAGAEVRLPLPHEISWRTLTGMRKYEVAASAWSDDFYFWSASMGEAGILQRLNTSGVTPLELPTGVFGPATMVWDAAGGHPVGVLDPFGFHPLPSEAVKLGWLQRSIKELRDNDPSLELSTISVTSDAQTAIVQARQGLICSKLFVVRAERVQLVDRTCARGKADVGTPRVTPHEIPVDGYALKGRLYSWSADRPSDGLLIVFEGGPQSNSVREPPHIAAEALKDRFDILVVDYRGAVGFGWRYLTDLKQPLSDVAATDLRNVITWAKKDPKYAAKPLGFWGDSWGGYAGLLAATRGIAPIDFIVSNSGFIENPPDGGRRCKEGIFKLLFGADDDNNCVGAQLAGEVPKVATPILMIVGDQDKQALPEVAHKWAASAKSNGACVGVVSSTSGEHVLRWPSESRAAALAAIRNWVASALSKRPESCQLAVALN